MKKLLVIAALAIGAYYAWNTYGANLRLAPESNSAESTPGANMKQRIDNRSGIAPE